MRIDVTAEFCTVADTGCLAPAGYRTNGGVADGDKKTRGRCFRCGEPVCPNCSKRIRTASGRKTVCTNCVGAYKS